MGEILKINSYNLQYVAVLHRLLEQARLIMDVDSIPCFDIYELSDELDCHVITVHFEDTNIFLEYDLDDIYESGYDEVTNTYNRPHRFIVFTPNGITVDYSNRELLYQPKDYNLGNTVEDTAKALAEILTKREKYLEKFAAMPECL